MMKQLIKSVLKKTMVLMHVNQASLYGFYGPCVNVPFKEARYTVDTFASLP